MKDVIKNLISQKEKHHLEFKQEWYWKNAEKPTEKQWGEFLKDLIALANCNEIYADSNKYLIIGIKEAEEDFEKSIVDTHIEGYTLDSLRNKIKQKVSSFFRADEDPADIEIILSYEEFYGKNILIIEIKPIQSLIVLSKDLKVKTRTEKKNGVFIRSLKYQGDPEVINASPEHIELIKSKLLSLKKKRRKEKSVGRSVEKTINSFVNGNSAFSLDNPRKSKNEIDLIHNKILFEVFPVKSPIQDIYFIYIFDQTNQIQTYEYLISKRIIPSDSTNFVLIDNGLKKDIGGIKKKFNAKEVYTLDEFALEYLYKDHLGEDIYHDGNFKKQRQIKNFIEPYTENSGEESALSILSNWFKKDSRPLMVLKGYGGVGKTTLVKYFLDVLYQEYKYKSEKSKILFIDSKKIVNEIAKEGNIDNIFPFYEAYVKLHDVSNKFNKELLELSIDNGNLLIILDGIDEVIAKLGNKFDISGFIKTIYDTYLLGNERTKIIITCRDYFWDSSANLAHEIDTIELSPFTEDLAEKFFEKEFERKSKEFKLCLKNAKEFELSTKINNKDVRVYIPYILDVIMDMVRQNKELGKINRSDISDKYLNPNMTNDYFIGRICKREESKLDTPSADIQLRFFMNMALYFNGVAHTSNKNRLLKDSKLTQSDKIFETFKGHTFILYDQESDSLYFKYDFFREYFLNLTVTSFFKNSNLTNFNSELKEIISEYIRYDNSFTNYICKRLEHGDELKLFIIDIVQTLIKKLETRECINTRKLISSMVILLLVSLNLSGEKNDALSRTDLLKDIFGDSFEYLTIINLLGDNSCSPTFDFRTTKILNSWFENYNYFWECKTDDSTSFIKSTFKDLEQREGIKITGKIHENLFVDCDTSGIQELLDKEKNDKHSKKKDLTNEVKKVFKFFEQGGTFKEQKIENIRKKSNTNVLDLLIRNKVIHPYKNPKRPTMRQYRISDKYYDVIKVLEQNGTNLDLQKIVKLIS